ncbi:MAG: choice-of-anchor Q domain-containing protein, partial [Anaerolineales bacterium]
ANVSVDGANFLPFDTASFSYTPRPGFTLADQAEKFRQLNALVYDTNPYPGIQDLIQGWYNGQVTQPGQPFNANYVPAAYAGNAGDSELYSSVVRPYCRSCHLSQSIVQLASPAEVDGARFDLFGSRIMPHAEMTAHNFWSSSAPAVVARNRGWSYRVTRPDDPPPSGCVSGDCTLRNAIWDANDPNASFGQDIITFDVAGTFRLELAPMDGGGALEITDSLVILGHGPDQTIIDANGLDRVFHIHPGAEVIIKGVTIRGGSVSGSGGGILNEGRLVLIDSIVQSNTSTGDGAGIANLSGGTAEIDRSTIGPDNITTSGRGGGVFNDGSGSRLSLSNSTLTGNQAESGGGLYNLNAGAVLTVTFGTVTGNSATTTGGGLRNNGASLVVQNSLVAGNSGGGSTDCATSAGFTSLGHNLVGQNGSANGCPTTASDQILAGGVATALDPILIAPGGGVPYHALALGSPALDAIPLGAGCGPPSFDARDTARPLDGNHDGVAACDAGAVEAPPQWRALLPLVMR